jgi:hypothetical protein
MIPTGFLKMKRPRTATPNEVIRKRAISKPLRLQYAELLYLRKAVEDAEAKVSRRSIAPRGSPTAKSVTS